MLGGWARVHVVALLTPPLPLGTGESTTVCCINWTGCSLMLPEVSRYVQHALVDHLDGYVTLPDSNVKIVGDI